MFSKIKEILLGVVVFLLSCVILQFVICIPVPEHHDIYDFLVELGLLLFIIFIVMILFVWISKKLKLQKGYLWMSMIPFIIYVIFLPIMIISWIETKDLYSVCNGNDSDALCQCKSDFLKNNFPQNHPLYKDIINIEKIVIFDTRDSRISRAFQLKKEEGKIFIQADIECKKKETFNGN